ncbi:hypothetical protein BDY21DRAFT_337005 [Lineolata rhizophorae]|uniref:Uncharacterized protein n=1 Tax=Lineolata rhizophorae TaxID=578093 RepID=A0A6A6P7W1_9PEZI|nr:hypothetical protein BDY21DRAFT_337005 [Lineolata rhizophorae]
MFHNQPYATPALPQQSPPLAYLPAVCEAMFPEINDRLLWLGVGAFSFLAVTAVSYGLRELSYLTEVAPPRERPRKVSQETEDAIKLESLRTLASCNNTDIRRVATKMICDRFLTDPAAVAQLHADFQSTNPRVREAVSAAVRLLDRHCGSSKWRTPPRSPPTTLGPTYTFSPHTIDSPGGNDPSPSPASTRSRWATARNFNQSRARPLAEESPEEQALRRRRREAMVLNEGDRPVSADDIIQRGGRVLDEEVRRTERALATLANGTGTDEMPSHNSPPRPQRRSTRQDSIGSVHSIVESAAGSGARLAPSIAGDDIIVEDERG